MREMGELLRDVPIERRNQVYEKMASMDETERERFAELIAYAMASSPQSRGSAEARAAARGAREAAAPKVGAPAPEFTLGMLDRDERISLSACRGRPVGLIFGSYT